LNEQNKGASHINEDANTYPEVKGRINEGYLRLIELLVEIVDTINNYNKGFGRCREGIKLFRSSQEEEVQQYKGIKRCGNQIDKSFELPAINEKIII
jgi:hypothetical protein